MKLTDDFEDKNVDLSNIIQNKKVKDTNLTVNDNINSLSYIKLFGNELFDLVLGNFKFYVQLFV